MTNKKELIKAILQKDTEGMKAILNENAKLIVLEFKTSDKNILSDSDGNTYTLQEVENMANKLGMIVFLPMEGLSDEQIERYLTFNQ